MKRYEVSLKKLKNKEWKYGLDHFPEKLPQEIKNYYFQIETSFDGYDTHYVKFDTDKTYIDSLLKHSKCKIRTSKDKIDNYCIDFYMSELKEADKICILHKKTQQEVYTSEMERTRGYDKYYHAKANCESAQLGSIGNLVAQILSVGKEIKDLLKKTIVMGMSLKDAWNDSVADIKADYYGLEKGREGGYCGDSVKDVEKIFKKGSII